MAQTEQGDIVSFDVEAATEAARDAVEGTLYTFVEFDFDDWNDIYVAPETEAMYEDREQMEEHFGQIHSYVNVDFMEINLFTEDLLPAAERVRYKTTGMDVMTFVRIYVDDMTGVFLALDPDEAVEPVVAAIESTFE